MKIPITMCHGLSERLDIGRFEKYLATASTLGCDSITYDQLADWKFRGAALPERPIMFDFDHPVRSIRNQILDVMRALGFTGNLFVNTGPMEDMYSNNLQDSQDRECMTWREIGELKSAGWHIGAHTHTHPNLSELSVQDPSGDGIRAELEKCDAILNQQFGIEPRDFAFTGTSWSSCAEGEVKKRYRFGRLWIIGSTYEADGKPIRYADLVGVEGNDEADGGPPFACRYITKDSDPYKLPSMELEALIYAYDAFRTYLERGYHD